MSRFESINFLIKNFHVSYCNMRNNGTDIVFIWVLILFGFIMLTWWRFVIKKS